VERRPAPTQCSPEIDANRFGHLAKYNSCTFLAKESTTRVAANRFSLLASTNRIRAQNRTNPIKKGIADEKRKPKNVSLSLSGLGRGLDDAELLIRENPATTGCGLRASSVFS
jgi:hypothetical protein